MYLVVRENHNGFARAFIAKEEDVTASWLAQNFLTVMASCENEYEAIKWLENDGWEYVQSSDIWIIYAD